ALALLSLRPLRLTAEDIVDLKDQVELRLSRHFYDLAALAPQDAEAYARMRSVAWQRYGLDLLDGGLPAGSLAQGLDVIDVMRNVHLLATQYCYSLHQQFFTQASNQGEAKIRTITVEHLAASIRVHGYGVINTAVNYSVGFIKRKLEVVAEFLADESVKSRLLADKQWMQGRSCYTWARGVESAKIIRRLGAGRDGVSFLDKLRQVVSQIGNSLGYVRMVRTAGMRSMAGSLDFLEAAPWLGRRDEGPDGMTNEFLEAAESTGSDVAVKEAAHLADVAARSVRRCFEASTDHLNLLADVFTKALARPQGGGVAPRLFHLLVPVLGCCFLDALLFGRELLAKRAVTPTGAKGDAVLFDDGFAVGVAFVLRVFGLERDFQSLHWFQTEIADSDVAVGRAREAAGLPFQDSQRSAAQAAADRRALLSAELGHLAAAMEAASALFGAHAVESPAPEEPGPAADTGDDAAGD
ncbi:WASHC4, partial [Symbiodinium pilosum]